jgi:hypothetical protein
MNGTTIECTNWVPLGGVIDSGGIRGNVAGGANGPWLLYTRSPDRVRLLRWNGSDWEGHDVPTPAGANTLQGPNAMALANDQPVIAFTDFSLGVFVTRFVNGTFEQPFAAIGRPSQLSLCCCTAPTSEAVSSTRRTPSGRDRQITVR